LDNFPRADRCPVCLSSSLKDHRKGTFDFNFLRPEQVKITDSEYGKVWNLSLCASCGHLFANPHPAPEFLFALYSQVEDPLYEEEAAGRSQNFAGIIGRLERLRPERGALFDVGAATGIFCDLARRRGWTVDGIEPSGWAVRTAAEKYGLRLRHGDFRNADLPAGRYQAVTMIDLIEHTPRPREAAAQAFRILAPRGLLCLVTPDIHSLAARAAGRRWWHFRPGHLAYFSRQSLTTLLAGAGFRILETRRYAWTFSLHYLLTRRKALAVLARPPGLASFFKRLRIKLALADSFEVYAVKDPTA
jgi:SAM-dependent methyltransferase